MLLRALSTVCFAGLATALYDEYILAPKSRTIIPTSVYQVNGTVDNANSLLVGGQGSAAFTDDSTVTYDFGINIAGITSLVIGDVDPDQYIGIAYSESSLRITREGSDATADAGLDEVLWFQPSGPGNYTVDPSHNRGGFKYLSLIHNTTGKLEVEQLTVHYTAMPHVAENEIAQYSGHFHSNDELINRIDPRYGDALPFVRKINSTQKGDETPPHAWYSNYTITNGTSALVDGAKRDRLVWAGDMAIAVPAIIVSYDDLVSVANSLDSLFQRQNESGLLPYAGAPFPSVVSFTYHLYTLIGVADYYLYSGEVEYARNKWPDYKRAINWSLSNIDSTGLMNVTSPNDWLRFGMGGHNIEANAILYYTLQQTILLGEALNEDPALLSNWSSTAATIKTAANELLWNEELGLFVDNETTTLAPQDGNSWAVVSNLTLSSSQTQRISNSLSSRWGQYGAPAPEATDAISPFISGFELQAHMLANNASAALDLVRLQWGFMLDDPRMTNSTFIEGYSQTGELHYAPYTNDPRVSHAHGWATGPTSTLTFYVAGIHILSAGGKTWELSPRLGGLRFVDAGFETVVGTFRSQVNGSESGLVEGFKFSTPMGTMGSVSLPGVEGRLRSGNGTFVSLVDGMVSGVPGGDWELVLSGGNSTNGGNGTNGESTGVPYTGGASTGATITTLLGAVAVVAAFL
ncbi:glycoside hydrolase family 78 protein [Cercospora zeae-maydis SCOH1-5]|uniref:Glycoside hydrolase family 78 protein n=1 Tax=Cercospora zeae-maydis SCOH1-5 TaxID=717836 RepID=A0A6A6F6W5_9PEZI|nr:glycoside hydrolase family 78 protein [Cercospora zeae-maydis SCOH1-5]